MPPPASAPQAPLSRVRIVVDAIAGGARSRALIASASEISPRHIDYALAACRLLGLVHEREDGGLELTDPARRLNLTSRGSPEEAKIFRARIEASQDIQRLAPDLLSPDEPKPEQLARGIKRQGKLADSTARQRAQVLLGWRKAVLSARVDYDILTGAQGTWRRIVVKNFRSIQDLCVDLPPFSSVVGPNGSGKSNFADILMFAAEVGENAAAAIDRRGGIGGVRRWRPTRPTDVSIDIRAAASADDLDADYVRHAFKLRSGAAGDWHFAEETVEVVRGGQVQHAIVRKGDDIKVTPERQRLPSILPTASVMVLAAQLRELGTKTTPLRHVRRYRLNPDLMRQPALAETTRLEETGQNIASAVRSLAHAGSSAELTLRLAKILPGLVDLKTELIGRHLVLKFLQKQDGDNVAEFNATEMSDGALRALGILVAALQMRQHELLIVEEPEVAVHIGAASFLYGVLREAADKGAVLLTTHSADLLDAAREEEILVCEYAQGVTKVGPLDENQREIVREGLFSLAELMRSEPLRMA